MQDPHGLRNVGRRIAFSEAGDMLVMTFIWSSREALIDVEISESATCEQMQIDTNCNLLVFQ